MDLFCAYEKYVLYCSTLVGNASLLYAYNFGHLASELTENACPITLKRRWEEIMCLASNGNHSSLKLAGRSHYLHTCV